MDKEIMEGLQKEAEELYPDKRPLIEVIIKRWKGNMVRFERYNDGLRYPIDNPYREAGANAKFRLPSGKAKCERCSDELTDEQILTYVQKKYSNYRFVLSPPPNYT